MIEWIFETFGLLFNGIGQVVEALLRIGLAILWLGAAGFYIYGLINSPGPVIRVTVALISFPATVIVVTQFINQKLPFIPTAIAFIVSVIAAYHVTMFILNFGDKEVK